MAREESELRIPSSLQFPPDEDVMQLVEQWIQGFEGVSDEWPDSSPEAPQSSPLETLRADWNRLARSERTRGSETEIERPSTPTHPKADQLPLKSAGLLMTFTDRIGGSISLVQVDGHLQHRGTVAPRGRCASVEAACVEIGLPDHVTRAFEFVASWFGLPFDSTNLRPAKGHVLTWGFWGLAGADLIGCLQQWKREAPDRFEGYLRTFGLDVLDGSILRVQSDQGAIQGRGAEWAIATEPRLLAVLARSGRDPAAQKAQIEMVLANWVTPVMFHPWDRAGDEKLLTVEVLKSARHVAALLYLARRHGRRTAMRLVQTVNERYRPQDNEEAWLEGLVRSLRNLNREHDSCEVLRISSSPELTAE